MGESPTTPLRAEQYLAPETLAQLAPFELRAKRIAEGLMNGMHVSPRKGSATDFASHRQYVSGDSIRHVDWKVFARSDKLQVKQFQQETNLNVVILVDGSASMQFGTLDTKSGWGGTKAQRGKNVWTKYDHATAIAAAISFLALRQRDQVGLGIFADGIRSGVRRSGSNDHWRSVVRCLAADPVDSAVAWERVADQAVSQNPHQTLFIIISDLLAPPAVIQSALSRIGHRGHDVILVTVLDRAERTFNMDVDAAFVGLEGEPKLEVETRKIRAAYLAELEKHLADIDRIARGFRFDVEVFDSHESVGPVLSSLLARREAILRRRFRG